MPNIKRPKVGVGVYIKNKKGEILLLKRKGAHGSGTWYPPGGHLEFGESFEKCARREAKEELDVNIKNIKIAGVTNDIFGEKHYITIAVKADLKSGNPKIMEPRKSTEFGWFKIEKFPQTLFLPVKHFLKYYKS